MFDDRSPIYQQIADKIKDDVLSGALREDEQVMSTNQYAAYYRINPATAAKGFHQLIDEGILYKRRGIGMFVSPDARERLLTQRRDRFSTRMIAPWSPRPGARHPHRGRGSTHRRRAVMRVDLRNLTVPFGATTAVDDLSLTFDGAKI